MFMEAPVGKPGKNRIDIFYKNGTRQWAKDKIEQTLQDIETMEPFSSKQSQEWRELFQDAPTEAKGTIPSEHQLMWPTPLGFQVRDGNIGNSTLP